MKKFFVITNPYKDRDLRLTHIIKSYVEEKGGRCAYLCTRDARGDFQPLDVHNIPSDTQCILVLGGDGTLIRAAREVVQLDIPLIGVNMGTLGYLCELEEDNILSALDLMLEDNYVVEERMLLSGYAIANNQLQKEIMAVNDVVIHRTGGLQLVSLIMYVNGEYLKTYHADGMILASPTGSTGYSMSAGGPIVDPQAKLLLATPISAHELNSKSIVFGADDEIVIEIGTRRPEKDEVVEVSFDGDSAVKLEVGDRIVVRRAKERVRILKLSKISFLEILRKKMQAYS
ncbi:MAG: NAD(+)/NADH kinase [Lachnospiraceae bacterium]